MPELPEVEVTRMGLAPHLTGQELSCFRFSGKPLRLPVPVTTMADICHIPIIAVRRRAKYILVELQSGKLLVFHLGMTGNLGIFAEDTPRRKHDHLEWRLSSGQLLRFHDPRRFGSVAIVDGNNSKEMEAFFKTSGMEPLSSEFTADYLQQAASRRSLAIKPFLMTSQIVVGIGNIYANESLFDAQIRPDKSVAKLQKKEWQRLVPSIQKILRHAIDCGGSTISDFRSASQRSGYFQISFQVYGRAGQPCKVCATKLRKITLGGRSTFFCPACQR